jgi:hypothetical protein
MKKGISGMHTAMVPSPAIHERIMPLILVWFKQNNISGITIMCTPSTTIE